MTHFFSRLERLIKSVQNEKNIQEAFQNLIKSETKTGTLFDEYLKKNRMANGKTFYDVLTDSTELPYKKFYKNRDIIEDIICSKHKEPEKAENDRKTFEELLKKLDVNIDNYSDNFYFEYLQNYFRFARKIAADEKGGVDE